MERIEKVNLSEINRNLVIAEGFDYDKKVTEYDGFHFDSIQGLYKTSSLQSHDEESRFPLNLVATEPEGVLRISFDENGICTETFFFSNKDIEREEYEDA